MPAPSTPRLDTRDVFEDEGDSEAAPPRRVLPDPGQPTESEMEEHRIDHIPYRCWCPECVEGFGREKAHQSNTGEDRSIPLVSCDYLYLTPAAVLARDEISDEDKDSAVRVIVAKCSVTKCIFAHAVPQKGIDEKQNAVVVSRDY